MSPTILRQLWSIIEQTQAQTLLSLSQADLVNCLIAKLQQKKPLSHDEYHHLNHYITLRATLIRDLAQARLEEQMV
ncbi:hypothetical protein VB715_10155 [Crocosphaera sp. UHCC 0190]|uniref:hypothetical protein n=1 Tax=Crocosphaera sp. UHCC 0190 TaxID=3110246 RepID=UPI002B205788|nr:hypothetical protein [Crocosphaera sp. UHCC 0190]MEA5510123.1 hypothetical protein [Crocosphaera sp. UHCC 0190]